MRKIKEQPKYIVCLFSPKDETRFETILATNGEGENRTDFVQNDRGCCSFSDLNDVKETLNWNLYGNDRKYQFRFEATTDTGTYAKAFIYD